MKTLNYTISNATAKNGVGIWVASEKLKKEIKYLVNTRYLPVRRFSEIANKFESDCFVF